MQLELQGTELLTEALEVSAQVRSQINQVQGLHCFGPERAQPGFLALDPLRITVDVSQLGIFALDGFRQARRPICVDHPLSKCARTDYGCYATLLIPSAVC